MADRKSVAALGAALATALALAGGAEAQEACATGQVALAGRCAAVADVAATVRTVITDAIARDHLQAVIAAVEIGGVPILSEAWGSSMTGVPATTGMHWRNGAIAIPYLTTVLLRLDEEGVLDLDDPLSKWLPDLPEADRVTLRMLANNTSGYPDYVDISILPLYQDPFRAYTPDDLITLAFKKPMACEPGACFNYAHTNYVVLADALAAAAGRDTAELIRSFVLEPLGLHDTRSEQTADIPEPVLHAFTAERGTYEDSTFWNPSWTLGRGAVMTTTVPDALVSAAAIGTGRLLSDDSYAAMVAPTPQTVLPSDPTTYYGLGVIVSNGWLMQTPSFGGFAGAMGYLPGPGIAIALTVTASPATPIDEVARRLLGAIGVALAPDQPPRFVLK
jgi:CubicO group peptidase (beta-lactamase class C family)